jgi:hypothetical protein
MAYRAPRYSYVHAVRDLGVDAITLSSAADADFPVENLIDDRAGTLFKVAAPTVAFDLEIDLGADFATDFPGGLDRLIIPANHNLTYFRVWEDTDPGFGTKVALAGGKNQYPGTLVDYEFTASSKQYLQVHITGASTAWQLPQFFLTKIVELDTGVALADSPDSKIDNVTRLERNNGQSPTIQHGPQQRVIEYEYESPLEGTDLTAMEALVNAVGMVRPFYVDPAEFHATPGTDEPALCMKFAEMPESRNSVLVPMNGERSKVYRLRLIESLD